MTGGQPLVSSGINLDRISPGMTELLADFSSFKFVKCAQERFWSDSSVALVLAVYFPVGSSHNCSCSR